MTVIKTFDPGFEQPTVFAQLSLPQSAINFVASHLGIDNHQVAYKSGFIAETTKVAYVNQAHDGVLFANAVANVAWKDNKVVAFGSSFVNADEIAPSKASLRVETAISTAEELLDGKYNNHPSALEYLVRPGGSISLAYVVQIQNEESGTWYEAFVDAHSGTLLTVVDFVSDALYYVLPIVKETFPEGQEITIDPQDLFSSPLGWHDDGTTQYNATIGNNVIAFKGYPSNVTYQNADCLIFNYTYHDTVAPTVEQNIDAARTNAFYIINTMHDLAYRYGFTEAAFNFQRNNFGNGGKENDPVFMSVQDPSGLNNANFGTPPDGQSGICRMYVWTFTRVRRDGALENDIVVHEMTHGITNRMTGGGTARCLQTTEARGMGEGWSDAMAEWTEQTSENIKDYVMGQYVINNTAGIRNHPYSTSPMVNPLRYSSIASLNEVHNIGEVWANLLHNVYAALVAEYGYSDTARATPEGTEGNIIFLHLFIDALALQPCNPNFVSARDAWLQADVNRYGGENSCLLWRVFASRGLGVHAARYIDSNLLPPACTR